MSFTNIVAAGCLLAAVSLTVRSEERAPISEFLMPQVEEVVLARSAAPPNVGANASVWVMTAAGYRQVAEGSNGFTCVVERSWAGPLALEAPDEVFWNPRVRAPICYNRAAAEVWAKQRLKAEKVLAGENGDSVLLAIGNGYRDGSLKAPEPSAMAYMLSAGQYLGDRAKQAIPHLMLYQPYATNEDWGDNPRGGVAFVLAGAGSLEAVVIVPVKDFVEVGAP